VHHGLKAVKPLGKGRSEARESDPVRPAPEDHIDAIRPHVARQVWAMVELQRLSGMRPGEVTIMRTMDLDMSGSVWEYTPDRHKTEHHDRDRRIYVGPKGQEVLRPWLRADRSVFLFSPAEAEEERRAERRRARRSPMTPSQRARTPKPKPGRAPRGRYDSNSYRHAVAAGCRKAGVPAWHPNQLRHNAATRLRKEFGLDIARVILGHTSPAVTEVYAEVDRDKALAVMAKVG
jgi:integrase